MLSNKATQVFTWAKSKETYDFFVGYCDWSESLRVNRITDEELTSLYSQVESLKCPARSEAVLKYRLLKESETRLNNPLMRQYYDFLDSMRQSNFWINDAFQIKNSYNHNTFMAPQSFVFNVDKDVALIQKLKETHAKDRASKNVKRIMLKIKNLGSKHTAFDSFFSFAADTSTSSTSPLAQIHYEVSENMDHWMAYPENKRSLSGDWNFFGDTLLMDVKLKIIQKSDKSADRYEEAIDQLFAKYPIEFRDFAKSHISRVLISDSSMGLGSSKSLSFVEISYLDNGRGVRRNIENFSSNDTRSLTLKNVIERRVSTRQGEGGGRGFTNIIQSTRDLRSLFFMQSGNEIVSVSGHGKSELNYRKSSDDVFGTLITYLVPMTPYE